jgi:hypothetical protein
MAVAYEEKEYQLDGVNYTVEVEIYARLVSGAFDHAFGTHNPGDEIEVDGMEIMTVYNDDGDVVTSRAIIQQLENIVDADDFEDVEFDFSE